MLQRRRTEASRDHGSPSDPEAPPPKDAGPAEDVSPASATDPVKAVVLDDCAAVRGILNDMRRVLDVNFREDDSRTRERTSGSYLSWLRRFAVTLLKRHPNQDNLRGKTISCTFNTEDFAQGLSLQQD